MQLLSRSDLPQHTRAALTPFSTLLWPFQSARSFYNPSSLLDPSMTLSVFSTLLRPFYSSNHIPQRSASAPKCRSDSLLEPSRPFYDHLSLLDPSTTLAAFKTLLRPFYSPNYKPAGMRLLPCSDPPQHPRAGPTPFSSLLDPSMPFSVF